jgi:hypothetical protein
MDGGEGCKKRVFLPPLGNISEPALTKIDPYVGQFIIIWIQITWPRL